MDNYIYIINEFFENISNHNEHFNVWIVSLCAACAVGVCSKLPLYLLSLTNCTDITTKHSSLFKYLLSFAIGGLLGDVFLDLIPEAWNQTIKSGVKPEHVPKYMGFWILCGIIAFGFMEVLGNASDKSNNTNNVKNHRIKVTGYLSLLTNAIDNFAHGLALGASFLVNYKTGLMTTFAIIIHEIPHEIGDFAILIKSGFTKWSAVKAQSAISLLTIAATALTLWSDSTKSFDSRLLWILPFTSGGFLYIAMVSIMPELIKAPNISQGLCRLLCIVISISLMLFIDSLAE